MLSLQDIYRWYDVEVRVAQPIVAALPFSGVLTEQSSGAVIDRVAATLGLRVRRHSNGPSSNDEGLFHS